MIRLFLTITVLLSFPFLTDQAALGQATLPFVDDFEAGTWGPNWTTSTEYFGRIEITDGHSPQGTRHVTMDSLIPYFSGESSATLSVDLSSHPDCRLEFMYKEFGAGGLSTVQVSDDGVNFHQITSLNGTTYAVKNIDLDQAASNVGVSLTSGFKIRFKWSGNDTIPDEGLAIDNVRVYDSHLLVPEESPSIQAAIDETYDFTDISVKPGTYNENIDFKGKILRVFSREEKEAVIDGGGLGSVVSFAMDEDADSILEGFVITNGSAAEGGGVYCYNSTPTIRDNLIIYNTATDGGGIYWRGSGTDTINIGNNEIVANSADRDGGGICCNGSGTSTISENSITGNSANYGAGIYCYDIDVTTAENYIGRNRAAIRGGGIQCYFCDDVTITGNSVVNNIVESENGGGLWIDVSATIENNVISGNAVLDGKGGGIYLTAGALSFKNNLVCGNRSSESGGGIYALYDGFSLLNSSVCDNTSGDEGGGLYINMFPSSNSIDIKDSIFWGNVAANSGGQIHCYRGTFSATYCDIQGGASGAGNIDANPLFCKGPSPHYRDYYLSDISTGHDVNSPCSNTGSDTATNLGLDTLTTRTDHVADSWIVDMGYHYSGTVWTVSGAPSKIQTAIDSASAGDLVFVGPGTYCEDLDFTGKAIAVTSSHGAGSTIIRGTGTGSVVTFGNYEGPRAVIDGFTIENGHTTGDGGGISCGDTCSPTIRNNIIQSNTADSDGGGLSTSGTFSTPVIRNNIFKNNTAVVRGGGVFSNKSTPFIGENEIHHNTAEKGGGAFLRNSSNLMEVEHNVVLHNSATLGGGGVRLGNSSPATFRNNLVCHNTAGAKAGGIHTNVDLTVSNCTVCFNASGDMGGGILGNAAYTLTVIDSILWGNTAVNAGDQIHSDGTVAVSYSDVQDNQWTGPGIIDTDPLFADFFWDGSGEFFLSQTASGQDADSPCRDAGSDIAVNLDLDSRSTRTDLTGDTGTVDLGFHCPRRILEVPDSCATIQGAIDAAARWSLVVVGPGTYDEDIDFGGKGIKMVSRDGAESTVLRGTGAGSVVTIASDSDANCVFEGFTVTNGNSSQDGGGVYCLGDSPLIAWNLIHGNSANGNGGGMYCKYGNPQVFNNIISGNSTVTLDGGGIYFKNSSSSEAISNNIIDSNTAAGKGGGIYLQGGLSNSLNLTGNTIYGNTAGDSGGGICCEGQYKAYVENTLLWSNSAPSGPEMSLLPKLRTDRMNIDHSDVMGGQQSVYLKPGAILQWGAGMIDADPLFAAPATGDFHLTEGSPCIDTGNSGAAGLRSEDIDGENRIMGTTVDMGADEYDDPTLVTLVSFRATGSTGGVLVEWETESEINNAGFHLWRRIGKGGADNAYQRITKKLIPAQGGASHGAEYVYTDAQIKPGRSCVYLLEDVSYDGRRTFHGPVRTVWTRSGIVRF